MNINHIGIRTNNLERLKSFYVDYFAGKSSEKQEDPATLREYYTISFGNGASLELIYRKDIHRRIEGETLGLCHLSFTLDSEEQLNSLISQLKKGGYVVSEPPVHTAAGKLQYVAYDPDSNKIRLEIR